MRAPGRRAVVAVAAAAALVIGTPLAAAAKPAPPVVSMSVDDRAPEVGDTVTVSGVVTHVPLSTTVTIQRGRGSHWRRVQVGFTGGHGEYVVSFLAAGLGREPLRAVVAAAATRRAATSPTRTITVRDWFPLDDVPLATRTGEVAPGAATVLGAAHAHVVVFAPDDIHLKPTATWELDGVCDEFRANVLWDETTEGKDGLVVIAGGRTVATGGVSKAAPVDGLAGDLHRARRIVLETDGVENVMAQRAAWVDAGVRCTMDPADL